MKIYHLSDLHIRAGCNSKARFSEYSFVFGRFVSWLQGQDNLDQSMVVITGDVFHHKSKIESPGIKLFYDFLKGLAGVGLGGGVIVIRGNHDYKQWDRNDEIDLIGSLLIPGISGVRYINETGVVSVVLGGKGTKAIHVQIGVLAIQDVCLQGDTVAANRVNAEAMPEFPRPSSGGCGSVGSGSVESVGYKVALFHGAVPNTIVAARNFFMGYDVAMLGDVHNQQVWGEGKRLPSATGDVDEVVETLWVKTIDGFTYGYAGSMIRQTMGEPVKGHGFLVWDLEHGLVTAHHVKNPIEFADAQVEQGLLNEVARPLLPVNEKGKVDGEDSISHSTLPLDCQSSAVVNPWITYMLDHGGNELMASFIDSPEHMLLPFHDIQGVENAVVEAKTRERQGKIQKKLDGYFDSIGSVGCDQSVACDENEGGQVTHDSRPGSFRLILARWDWVLCYGAGNVFDFGKLDGKINILAARNGHGKTSFLEMILLGLYGTGFPSRTNRLRTASVICLAKPPKTACQVVLTVRLGGSSGMGGGSGSSGNLYRITRQFNRQEDAKKLHVNVKATLVEVRNEEGNGWTGYLSGKTAVDKWVVANIGPMSSFLLSCMVSQNADNDFFSLSAAEQKELLDTAINVESHTRFMELVKESRLAHMAISDLIGATIAVLNKSLTNMPNAVTSAARINTLDKWIGEAGIVVGLDATGSLGMVGRLEPRAHYEAILAAADARPAVNIGALEASLAELKMLKTNAAKHLMMNGGGSKMKSLAWYVDELAGLDEEPVEPEDGTVATIAYEKAAFVAAAAAFYAASDAMTGDLEEDHGLDVGPYNEACECCMEKKREHTFLTSAKVYATHIRAKRGYLQGCIATIKSSQVSDMETALLTAKKERDQRDVAAVILARYDEIAKRREVTDWMLERQRLVDIEKQRTQVAGEMDQWGSLKKTMDERVTTFGQVYKIMDGWINWMYTESILPRVTKCTTQVMSLIDPTLQLQGTVGSDGFEWTLSRFGAAGSAPPIEKASGFQRFLCGLAVRIALGGIGAAGTKPRQLFLDEGFTSCDQANLAKVPEMLRTLLQLYDSIVLVTHLDDLKEAIGDETIQIKRDEEQGISKLIF